MQRHLTRSDDRGAARTGGRRSGTTSRYDRHLPAQHRALLATQRLAGNAAVARLLWDPNEPVSVQRKAVSAPCLGSWCCDDIPGITAFPGKAGAARARTDWRIVRDNSGRFEAKFVESRSFVPKRVKGPAHKVFGGQVRDCKRTNFDRFSFKLLGDDSCSASFSPKGPQADSKKECDTVIKPALEQAAERERPRLQEHEQYHLNIPCQVAAIANAAEASGDSKTIQQVTRDAQQRSDEYDQQTDNGCDQEAQDSYESLVDGGFMRIERGS